MLSRRINILMLVIPVFLSACAISQKPGTVGTSGLTFIHVNDTYRISDVEDGKRGGLARVVTTIRQAISEGRDVHVLHGGDLLSPSLESQIWFGGQMVDAMNFVDDIAPSYLVAGNHEFDVREDNIAHFINAVRSSKFDWIGDNYTLETGDPVVDKALKSAFTFKTADKKIGIFSITLHPQDGGTDRSYVNYDPDYIGNAKRVIQQFESQGVDMIIGLTHLHMETDEALAKLRKDHPTFEFIVGGHEHEIASREQTDQSAAVFKGSSNARIIWRIDVDFSEQGDPSLRATSIDMDSNVLKDSAYQVISTEWQDQLLQLYPVISAQVGRANFRLDATEDSSRNKENAWGNFIADQARTAFGKPKSDLAFINSGMIRIDDYIADEITYEDIARTFGFPSPLRRVAVTGSEFINLLQAGYRGVSRGNGYFPQVSGFRVCIDRTKPDNQKIRSLQVPNANDGWMDIDADKVYTLILPDYLFGNRDGYSMPKRAIESASLPGSELKYLVVDAIIRAQYAGEGIGTKVDPSNPRLVDLGDLRKTCWNDL